jgi:tape measure domain-containing protein
MGGAAGAFGKSARGAFDGASRSSSRFGDIVKGILAANVVQRGFDLLKQGIGGVISETAKFENAVADFTTLTGSAEAATKTVNDLNAAAAATPFEFGDLSQATKTLLGFEAATQDNLIPTLKMLGDTAAGNAERFNGIVLAFSQIQAAGRSSMQDVNQLVNNGVPILGALASQWGVTVGQAREMVSQGRATGDEVTKAFKAMTSEGGKFFGGMERASQTFTGRMATLKDTIKLTAVSLGQTFQPQLKQLVDLGIVVAEKMKIWFTANQELIKSKISEFVKTATEKIKAMVPYLQMAWKAIKILASTMAFLSPLIGPIVVGLIAMKTAMMAVAFAKFIQGIHAIVAAKGLWVAIQTALNLAFWVSPIGIFIASVMALAVAAFFIIKNWQKVKDFFVGLWEWIKGKWDIFAKLLGFSGGDVNVNNETRTVPARQAPNAAAAERQSVNVGGEVLFKNAPPGTQVRNTGSPDIDMALAGVNP